MDGSAQVQHHRRCAVDESDQSLPMEPEDQKHYIPPTSHNGKIQGAVLVSDGVEVVQETQDEKCDSAEDGIPQEVTPSDVIEVAGSSDTTSRETGSGEEEGDQVDDSIVVEGKFQPLVLVEVDGDVWEGSATSEGPQEVTHTIPSKVEAKEGEVTLEGITSGSPRAKLRECTAKDPSLVTIRHLADADSDGYQWDEGLIFRHRLDSWGDPYRQLCLPLEYHSRLHTRCLDTGAEIRLRRALISYFTGPICTQR